MDSLYRKRNMSKKVGGLSKMTRQEHRQGSSPGHCQFHQAQCCVTLDTRVPRANLTMRSTKWHHRLFTHTHARACKLVRHFAYQVAHRKSSPHCWPRPLTLKQSYFSFSHLPSIQWNRVSHSYIVYRKIQNILCKKN